MHCHDPQQQLVQDVRQKSICKAFRKLHDFCVFANGKFRKRIIRSPTSVWMCWVPSFHLPKLPNRLPHHPDRPKYGRDLELMGRPRPIYCRVQTLVKERFYATRASVLVRHIHESPLHSGLKSGSDLDAF
jgi:hypothetical protein